MQRPTPGDAFAHFLCAFEFDRREFIRASRLIDRHAIRNPIWRWASRAILSIAALFLGVMAIGQFWAGYWQTAAIGLIPLLGLLAMPLLPFLTAYGAARQWEKLNPAGARTVTVEVNDDVVATSSSVGRFELRWSAAKQVIETPEFFLFYMTDKAAVYLPTRALQPSSVGQLRSLVRRRAPNDRVRLIDHE
jgi:hypothetical protein